MPPSFRPKLTYANVMATAAVALIAIGGTGYAAVTLARNSVGTAQLKKNAVTGVKVKDGSLTANDLSAAARASLRGQTGATGATGAAGPGTVTWATFGRDGTIKAQSGGVSLASHPVSGVYYINMGTSVARRALSVSYVSDFSGGAPWGSAAPDAQPCGMSPTFLACSAAGTDNTNHAFVRTFEDTSAPPTAGDHAFTIIAIG